ncbi:type I-B CRISPR-associated protein Cas5b [Spirosoma fluviale]|uniref:CRISPR-associated protein Cas5h n=1 Tax=Spirosoma fluviale TaxID=1597977 RepID=A0A286GC91_9BACT|nr:type I-B CRISPR-associated protein Cas5b [Spirosoma fluviale]SOD93120.1 CRISPR-associated protein Cas5h [Spirosoma fluviale]
MMPETTSEPPVTGWKELLSFDLKADFGFFRKPDVNEGIQYSYNMLHKPALLGIMGAIAGLKGYQQKGHWPQYYTLLKSVLVGIAPLNHERGSFAKVAITYTNTVGYANADGALIVHENTLRCPAYRVFVLLDHTNDVQARLATRIKQQEAEFVPYLGKNEFTAWWDNVHEYEIDRTMPTESFALVSLFDRRVKTDSNAIASGKDQLDFVDMSHPKGSYVYFERLPSGFDEELLQYDLTNFVYTDYPIKAPTQLGNLYRLNGANSYVQLT